MRANFRARCAGVGRTRDRIDAARWNALSNGARADAMPAARRRFDGIASRGGM